MRSRFTGVKILELRRELSKRWAIILKRVQEN